MISDTKIRAARLYSKVYRHSLEITKKRKELEALELKAQKQLYEAALLFCELPTSERVIFDFNALYREVYELLGKV